MKSPKSLLLCLILLTVLLGVKGRERGEKSEEDDDGEGTTEGDIVITTSRNESHASASAFASAGGASVTANAETTFASLTSVNGEPEDEDDDEEEENDDDDDKKPKKKSKARSRNKRDVERVRDAILNANVDRVASLLSRINDTDVLGRGFTYPADLREENLIFTRNRTMDPDVVALKGMAKAALEGDLSEKLTEVFIAAVYGLNFDESECFKAPKYTHSTHSRVETQNRTVTTSGYQRITNESGTFRIDNDPEVLNAVSQDTLYEETNVDFRETEASGGEEDEDEDEVCYTRKEMKTIRKNLRQDFSDVGLMSRIVEGTPEEVSRRRRSLLVVGTPVET